MTRTPFCFGFAAVLAILAPWAAAQNGDTAPEDDQPDLFVTVDVGYNTAFRNNTWTPVDVLVNNELNDLSGYVEVRTFGPAGELQSPVYRTPAECPQDSKKLFRLYAHINNTTRIEAWLFENGRSAVEVPSYVEQDPIEEDGLMGIVLDQEPLNFGFLFAAVQRENAEETTRFYRWGLQPPTFGLLPDIEEAYYSFNAIVLGEIDPANIPTDRRELIRDYVRAGGTLVVCTGAFAHHYRGSWVDELLGVDIGRTESFPEPELAASVFPPELRDTVRPDRTCSWAPLTPTEDDVQLLGEERVLAAKRPYGKGLVCTIAVDAASGAFQDSKGYRTLWRELIRRPLVEREPLPYDNVGAYAARQLPALSGVTIRPLRDVAVYLLLYLGVGVVGNWVFWSMLQRREMAWLCLIGFSAAFTGYAMFSGATGWTKSAELHSVDVVHVQPALDEAERVTATGILSARTRHYSGSIDADTGLAREFDGATYNPRMRSRRPSSTQPFAFSRNGESRIEEWQVGASELRMARVSTTLPMTNQFDGAIRLKEGGGVSAEFTNNSAWALRNAALFINGAFVPLRKEENQWRVNMNAESLYEHARRQRATQRRHWNARAANEATFLDFLRYEMVPGVGGLRDASLGPRVFGWLEEPLPLVFQPDQVSTTGFNESLLVLDLPVERSGPVRYPLSFHLYRHSWIQATGGPQHIWHEEHTTVAAPGEHVLRVGIARRLRRDPNAYLEFELYWPADVNVADPVIAPMDAYLGAGQPNQRSRLIALMNQLGETDRPQPSASGSNEGKEEALAAWRERTLVEQSEVVVNNTPYRYAKFHVEDWRNAEFMAGQQDRQLQFELVFPNNGDGGTDRQQSMTVRLAVHAVHPEAGETRGTQLPWQ